MNKYQTVILKDRNVKFLNKCLTDLLDSQLQRQCEQKIEMRHAIGWAFWLGTIGSEKTPPVSANEGQVLYKAWLKSNAWLDMDRERACVASYKRGRKRR